MRHKYDVFGRRIQRFIVGARENTKFIYDGADVIADDNSGTLTKYINGPKAFRIGDFRMWIAAPENRKSQIGNRKSQIA